MFQRRRQHLCVSKHPLKGCFDTYNCDNWRTGCQGNGCCLQALRSRSLDTGRQGIDRSGRSQEDFAECRHRYGISKSRRTPSAPLREPTGQGRGPAAGADAGPADHTRSRILNQTAMAKRDASNRVRPIDNAFTRRVASPVTRMADDRLEGDVN